MSRSADTAVEEARTISSTAKRRRAVQMRVQKRSHLVEEGEEEEAHMEGVVATVEGDIRRAAHSTKANEMSTVEAADTEAGEAAGDFKVVVDAPHTNTTNTNLPEGVKKREGKNASGENVGLGTRRKAARSLTSTRRYVRRST